MNSQYPKQGLLLDFGGVLTTDLFAPFETFCERRGLPRHSIKNLMAEDPEGRKLWYAVERGDITQPEFEQRLALLLGVNPDGLIVDLLADLRPEPFMLEAVATIRRNGCKVGIISNSCGTSPYDPYIAWNLPNIADAILISDEIKMRKPEPEIFLLACERINVSPSLCVFIDDIATNLPAAQNLGMLTIHHINPQNTITALRDVFPALQRFSYPGED